MSENAAPGQQQTGYRRLTDGALAQLQHCRQNETVVKVQPNKKMTKFSTDDIEMRSAQESKPFVWSCFFFIYSPVLCFPVELMYMFLGNC